MRKLIRIPFGDSEILVEVTSGDEGRAVPMGVADPTAKRVEEALENSLTMIERLGRAFGASLAKTTAKSAEMSLGLKFTAKGNLFLVESSGEATLNLKLVF